MRSEWDTYKTCVHRGIQSPASTIVAFPELCLHLLEIAPLFKSLKLPDLNMPYVSCQGSNTLSKCHSPKLVFPTFLLTYGFPPKKNLLPKESITLFFTSMSSQCSSCSVSLVYSDDKFGIVTDFPCTQGFCISH